MGREMHRDDQMTPRERSKALRENRAVDRMPIAMFYGSPGPALCGMTLRESEKNARTRADVQIRTYEVFGIDGLNAKYGLHSMGAALGAVMKIPENSPAAIMEPPIRDIRDLSAFDLDVFTVKKDPNASKCYEMAQILMEEMGDEVGCGFGMTSPFTSARAVVGTESLMRALVRYPEKVHELMELTLQASIQITRPFLEMDMPVSVSDPMASGTLISKRNYDEFVLPYLSRFVDFCKSVRQFPVTVHICGDTSRLLNSVAACGYDRFSIDNLVSIDTVKNEIGDSVHIMGNVPPIEVLRFGTPDDVRASVRQCYREGFDSPKGFTICTGCDTPMGTPLENSFAYMEEARKCARYPLNPENFEE